MKRLTVSIGIIGLVGVALNALAPTGANDPHGTLRPMPMPMPMPMPLQIILSLSARPPPLREGATVNVLDTTPGMVLEHTGTNGKRCFVSRTELKIADYRNDINDATCYAVVGAKNHMAVLVDVAALRAQGIAQESAGFCPTPLGKHGRTPVQTMVKNRQRIPSQPSDLDSR